MFAHTSFYSIHKKMPFSVYGENLIILAQNFIIVMLFWLYNKRIGILEKIVCFAFIVSYFSFLYQDHYLTEEMWEIVTKSNLFLSKLSFLFTLN
jgi:hypothetical protein